MATSRRVIATVNHTYARQGTRPMSQPNCDLVSVGRWRENSQAVAWVGKPIAEALKLDLSNPAHKAKVKGLLRRCIANGMFVVVEGKDERHETRSFVEVGE